jgi:hypothetical protein
MPLVGFSCDTRQSIRSLAAAAAISPLDRGSPVLQFRDRQRLWIADTFHPSASSPFESPPFPSGVAFPGKLVFLSAGLDWAWLQGYSRARRRRTSVHALSGFGFPPRLPAAPFPPHKQSAREPPKNCLAGLESGPFAPGRPNRSGHEKENKYMLLSVVLRLNFRERQRIEHVERSMSWACCPKTAVQECQILPETQAWALPSAR